MNPTALLTALTGKVTTGAQDRENVGQTDPMAFQKHLFHEGGFLKSPGTVTVAPAFSGILSGLGVLLAENVATPKVVEGNVQNDGIEVASNEEGISQTVLPSNLVQVVHGQKIASSDEVVAGVEDGSGDETQEIASAMSSLIAGVVDPQHGEASLQGVGVAPDSVQLGNVSPKRVLLNTGSAPAEVPQAGVSMSARGEKPEASAAVSAFIMPEMRRISTPAASGDGVKGSNVDPSAVLSGANKTGDSAPEIKPVQQLVNTAKLAQSGDGAKPMVLRNDAGLTPFSSGVTAGLNEVVTERQVSPNTVVSERTVVEQLSSGMVKVVAKSGGKVVIKLTPEHLGNVEVTLAKKGAATIVRVVVDRAETLDMVRAEIRSLERSLVDAGLDVKSNSINLSLRSSSEGNGASSSEFGNGNSKSEDTSLKKSGAEENITRPRRGIEGRGNILNISA